MVKKLNENALRKIIMEEINEMLGSFNKQYEISDLCSKIVKEYVLSLTKEEVSAIRSGKIDLPYKEIKVNSDDVSVVKIKISQLDVFGSTIGINPDNKTVIILIGVNSALKKSESELSDMFAHELMHGNVFLKRFENDSETYDSTPYYYDKLKIIFDNYYGTLAYNFAHALYACFYQETNALVSQVYPSIMMEVGESKINKNSFMKIYKNTNSFLEFNLILTQTIPLIKQMDTKVLEKEIIIPFRKSGIDIDENFVKKESNRIEKVAVEALKKCNRNASLCYNDLLKNKQIL